MLTLAEASVYFDRTEIFDPDNGKLLFYGQIDPYDESKRDAGGAYRRILSTAPGSPIPANRAIRAFGRVYVLGNEEVDGLESEHRTKYVMQGSPSKVSIYRLSSFLAGTPDSSAWSALQWANDDKEASASSDQIPEYAALMARGTDVRTYDILTQGGDGYLVSTWRVQPSGFLAADVVKLDFPLAQASITSRVYDAVYGGYTPAAPVTAVCLRIRWQYLFSLRTESAVQYANGDTTLVFPAGTTLNTSSLILLEGKLWMIVSIDTLGGAVTVHARPTWVS